MALFLSNLKSFFVSLSADGRIPQYDKRLLIIFICLLLLPLRFFLQGFAPIEPIVDFLLIAFICDYLFEILDPIIILSHYPWSMKSFTRFQRFGHFFAFFAINFIKNHLWKYKRDPF